MCLAAFAAAAIAHTPPMATGLMAWKIAKGLYIVPLLFAYTPFLAGDALAALAIFAFAAVGIYALTAALAGYAESPLGWPARAVLTASGVVLLWPLVWEWKLAALGAAATVLIASYRSASRARPSRP